MIVSILSPAYLESEWCRRELTTFLEVAAGRPRPASRAFVVEVTELPEGRPEGLREVLGYRAWYPESPLDPTPRTLGMPQPDPEDPRYYTQYSCVLVTPGLGTGYLPSLSAFKGAGESAVSLSRPGANSCLQLSMSSKVISWPV